MMGKIIVTGPGRAGTTFLMQLFTRCGLDTGFTPYREPYIQELRAGCEWNLHFDVNEQGFEEIAEIFDEAPRILKTPEYSMILKFLLSNAIVEIDHVFIPFRDFDISATSRLDAGLDWMVDPNLEGEEKLQDQANILALTFGRALEACILHEVPCTILRFPHFVEDMEYCFNRVGVPLKIDEDTFKEVWHELSRPEQIKWGRL